jgi:hypothetical protein
MTAASKVVERKDHHTDHALTVAPVMPAEVEVERLASAAEGW